MLLDAVGSRSGGSVIASALAKRGIRAARFLSPRTPIEILSVNLRNHRKLLIVDGTSAFTGGMNISDDYSGLPGVPAAIRDVHFAVDGPVVAELHRTFADDWLFTTGEVIDDAAAPLADRGDLIARVVADDRTKTSSAAAGSFSARSRPHSARSTSARPTFCRTFR